MKSFFKSCLNHGVEFFKMNANTIAGITMTAVTIAISKKFDIPLGYGLQNTQQTSYSNVIIMPRNSVEASILSIAKSAENMCWDSEKIRAAENICQIIKEHEVSDSTRSFAITILSDMSKNFCWDSSMQKINKLIMDITKGVN